MTYSKLEPEIDRQISSINLILDLAIEATAQENWLQVNNCLRQLPICETTSKTASLVNERWETIFQLALKVLLNAEFQHKWEVIKILPLLGKKIIKPLIVLLEEPTVAVETRWFICRVLSKFPEPEIVIALVKLLQQTSEAELIAVAAETLTQIGKVAIDELSKLLSQPEYRFIAAKSLAQILSRETIEPLIVIVNDSQPEIRTIAIEALGSFRDRRIPPLLVAALQDTSASVRKEAAIALGFQANLCQKLNLVARLQPLLYDLNPEVSRQAAMSLSKMRDESGAKAIYDTLQASPTPLSLKLDLVRALSWSNLPIALDYLQQVLFFTPEERLSQAIIVSLGRTSLADLKPQATQILIDWWYSQQMPATSVELKQALATSLGELGAAKARESLEQIAQDNNKSVQLHAIAALKKINNLKLKQ